MIQLSFTDKYNAIGNSEFEGAFITAVTSTGIFCRPSCRARKPKPENVIFYDSADEALKYGFRPCKICRPMESEVETPNEIRQLIKELEEQPHKRIKDSELRNRHIEPSYVRRWFKKHHSMTFHTYQRLLRLNHAYNQIKSGDSVTGSAFNAGYDSLSAFNDSYKNIFGTNPSNSTDKKVINIVRFGTRLGAMFACATDKGLCLLEFTDRRMLEWEFKDLRKRFGAIILPGTTPVLEETIKQVNEYMEGKRKAFDIPLDPAGTDFQKKVWGTLMQIPYGDTWTYKQQAEYLENSKAVRAVATANGYNKIALVIPCHRVIGSDGNLTGYAGGLGRKKWLLELESANIKE